MVNHKEKIVSVYKLRNYIEIMKIKIVLLIFSAITFLVSCESEQEKKERYEIEEKTRVELAQKQKEDEKAEAARLEKINLEQKKLAEAKRIEREIQLEEEQKKQEVYDKYISNSFSTGSTPYSKYYGKNSSCNNYGCSQIKVRTDNSDVLVTIKKNDKVVRHAYIKRNESFTFSFPNGEYQAFFYSGKGWNPEKEMKGGEMKGGFILNENFQKDEPKDLFNNILEYELIMQQNGNFNTVSSNPEEAL